MSEPAATTTAGDDRYEMRLVARAVCKSDVGRVRTENQDFAIMSMPSEETAQTGRLLVVADGMGGHRGGATASRLAGTTIKTEYLQSGGADIVADLRHALEAANERIYQEAQTNPELRGMGTTCSALVVRGDRAYFAHVGDSRIYLVRDGSIRQLTEDHSLVASMVREGLLTSQEAEVHPRRNVLQRSMGVSQRVEVDTPASLDLNVGDTFILCSDGLHGLVKEEEMTEVALLPIDDAAEEFVRRAIERGAPDNVTVIVARIEEAREQPSAPTIPSTMKMPAIEPTASIPPTMKMPAIEPDRSLPQTLKTAAITPDAPAENPAPEESAEAAVAADNQPQMAVDARQSGGWIRWLVITILLFVGAGAALYFVLQGGESTGPSNARQIAP